jgi:hypothetical protein
VKIHPAVTCLALLLFLAGAYLLQDSVRNSGHYADEGILIGALFAAIGLAVTSWSIKAQQLNRALKRHMKGR